MEYQNAVVSINEVTKSNDRLLTGLTILSPGERSAPTIYLEALAEQVEQGLPLDAAMKQIAQIQVENHNRVPLDISVLENYEAIRPMLAVQMCDPETNQEYLKGKGDTGGIDIAFKYLISECYSRDMSMKTKSAKYAKMRRGEYQSVICPYGYRKSADGRMEPDEDVICFVCAVMTA